MFFGQSRDLDFCGIADGVNDERSGSCSDIGALGNLTANGRPRLLYVPAADTDQARSAPTFYN